MSNTFKFKQFSIDQTDAPFKIGTDGVLLGSWCVVNNRPIANALDIGTGTGLIALMLAQRFPNASIHAVEINVEAAEIANKNFSNSPWKSRILLQNIALQDFTSNIQFDLIICNPPFFINSEISPNTSKNIARHEIQLKLNDILHFASNQLTNDGKLAVVLPAERLDELLAKSNVFDLFVTRICTVYPTPASSPKRILAEIERTNNQVQNESLIIESNGRHNYSSEYLELTKDFYLDK